MLQLLTFVQMHFQYFINITATTIMPVVYQLSNYLAGGRGWASLLVQFIYIVLSYNYQHIFTDCKIHMLSSSVNYEVFSSYF